ncbi:MAG: phosphatidate cytidylyltransferase [Proteobacteria bacterium]|nr:phosphatidate cytidylyltransferase [Pseudomonadota bacterium]
MGELKKRVITGILLAPLTAFLFYILPSEWFFALLTIVAVFAVFEYITMVKIPGKYLPLFIIIVSLVPLYYKCYQAYLMWLIASPLIYLFAEFAANRGKKEDINKKIIKTVAVILIGEAFIILPLFYVYLLKELNNYLPLILLFAIWSSDTCAYFTGKTFGKTPLVPQISPKKTFEGLIGAMFGSMIIIVLTSRLSGLSLTKSIIIGLLTGVLGQLGDIFESIGKRVSGVKDSSSLIPGHGGILDRMDSFIFTAPFLYNMYRLTGM